MLSTGVIGPRGQQQQPGRSGVGPRRVLDGHRAGRGRGRGVGVCSSPALCPAQGSSSGRSRGSARGVNPSRRFLGGSKKGARV